MFMSMTVLSMHYHQPHNLKTQQYFKINSNLRSVHILY